MRFPKLTRLQLYFLLICLAFLTVPLWDDAARLSKRVASAVWRSLSPEADRSQEKAMPAKPTRAPEEMAVDRQTDQQVIKKQIPVGEVDLAAKGEQPKQALLRAPETELPRYNRGGELTVLPGSTEEDTEREEKRRKVYFPSEWELDRHFPTDAHDVKAWKRHMQKKRVEWGLDSEDKFADAELPEETAGETDGSEGNEEGFDPYAIEADDFDEGNSRAGRLSGDGSLYISFPSENFVAEIARRIAGPPDFMGPGTRGWSNYLERLCDRMAGREVNTLTKVDVERLLTYGHGGEVVYRVKDGYIADDPRGYDFTIYENAFEIAVTATEEKYKSLDEKCRDLSSTGETLAGDYRDGEFFVELAEVSVAEDPDNFVKIPCSGEPVTTPRPDLGRDIVIYPGCAGVIPRRMGGDQFDIGPTGLKKVRYIKIRDLGDNERLAGYPGFDQDALVILSGVQEAKTQQGKYITSEVSQSVGDTS